MADTLAAVAGIDLAQATALLEACGGNLDAAMGMVFDSGPALPAAAPGGLRGADDAATAVLKLLLGPAQTATAAWRDTGLRPAGSGHGLDQSTGNGPCGLLAAVMAAMLARRPPGAVGRFEDAPWQPALAATVVAMVAQASAAVPPFHVARFAGDGALALDAAADAAALCAAVGDAAAFSAPGGLLLLAASLVATRGAPTCTAEATAEGGTVPLITEGIGFCTTELVNLALCGHARGSVGAYPVNKDGSTRVWRSPFGVGLLSSVEEEQGLTLADGCKSPSRPVWLLHGGDHFTVLWAPGAVPPAALEAEADPRPAEAAAVDLLVWNGLPPGGPTLYELALKTWGAVAAAAAHPAAHAADTEGAPDLSGWFGNETYSKPRVGQLEEVVQARRCVRSPVAARSSSPWPWPSPVPLPSPSPSSSPGARSAPPSNPCPRLQRRQGRPARAVADVAVRGHAGVRRPRGRRRRPAAAAGRQREPHLARPAAAGGDAVAVPRVLQDAVRDDGVRQQRRRRRPRQGRGGRRVRALQRAAAPRGLELLGRLRGPAGLGPSARRQAPCLEGRAAAPHEVEV